MAIDFPASPTNGQTFTSGSVTYTWDGTKWTAVAAGGGATDKITEGNTSAEVIDTGSDGRFVVTTEGTERARIDSSGRLLVGTSSARNDFYNQTGTGSLVQLEGAGSASTNYILQSWITNHNSASVTPHLVIGKSRGSTNGSVTAVQSGDSLGHIDWHGADGTDMVPAASVECFVDGTPGNNDMPGRLVFSVTRDGQASPTEALRITNAGSVRATTDQNVTGIYSNPTNGSYTAAAIQALTTRAGNSAFWFLLCESNNGSDVEFALKGDGNANADGTWTGGGADYAEYFEWSDSNPDEEDRRGISVVLDGEKIREAVTGEDPIGVISGNPSVVGDAAWNKWSGKYLRDEFGSYLLDENGDRQLSRDYDPDQQYIPREQRPEWDCVGLMGKLRIRKGQVTGSRWIKMRDISDSVEEWLVR